MDDNLHRWNDGIFLGIPMRQWQSDLWLWEQFFLNNPIGRMVELGSGSGGLSLFFMLEGRQYSFDFYTFDSKTPEALENPVGLLLEFGAYFYGGDIFEENKQIVINLISKRNYHLPTLLFCDNGWKPREVVTFAPYLQKGDYLAAHDWGTEIYDKDIPHDILEDISTDIYANSLTRWFRRK